MPTPLTWPLLPPPDTGTGGGPVGGVAPAAPAIVPSVPITGSPDYAAAQEFLREHLSPALTGDNWDALLAAVAVGDSYNKENARLAFDQLFRSSARRQYLDRRMADYGVRRPASIGMGDDLFRDLGLTLSNDALTNLALWQILEVYYGEDAVRANLTSAASEPFALIDGDVLNVRVDERQTIAVTFHTKDFKTYTQATAIEMAAVINRTFAISGSNAYAATFVNNGKTYLRVYSGALGMVGAIRVLGGRAQNVLQFPSKITSGTATTQWTLNYSPGTNKVLMQFMSGGDPILDNVRVGDYVTISGSAFSLQNRGSFTINKVYLDGSVSPRVTWVEFQNPQGTTETASQVVADDVIFYRATRSQAPVARITTADTQEVAITLPATTQAVNRTSGSGAYLHAQVPLNIVSLNRNMAGLVTVVTDRAHGLVTGGGVFIDGAYPAPNNSVAGWNTLASAMNQHRTQHAVTVLNSGEVLVTGGIDENGIALATVEKFNPSTRVWTTLPAMSKQRYDHRAVRLADGRVLVTGGHGLGAIIWGDAEIFDPSTNLWTSAGSMNNARTAHVVALLANNRVLVAGGCAAANYDIYDPGTGAWTNGAMLGAIGAYATATRLQDGHVLVLGGGAAATTAVLFRPETLDWAAQTAMSHGRAQHSATLLSDGRVLVVGGQDSGGVAQATTEIFSSGAWTAGPALAKARFLHSAVALASGKVMVIGGLIGPGNVAGPDIESYTIASGVWTTESSLNSARDAFGDVALLAQDKLVVVGGAAGGAAISAAEAYPTEGTGGGQNGFFAVTVVNPTTFTYTTPDFPFTTQCTSGVVLPVASPDAAGMPGPYIFDPQNGSSITSVRTTAQAAISAGQRQSVLVVADASSFPDAQGWLVIGFGTSYEQGPIQYSGRISNAQLQIDLTYQFTADIPVGADVTLLLNSTAWVPDHIESVGGFYVTASPAGRVAASATLDDVVAAGFTVEKTVLYPGDTGLGGEGWGGTGQKLSDAVSVWAGDDVDGEVAAAHVQ